MGQSQPLDCLLSFFSQYNFNNTNWKKCRWCGRDSNPRPQDGRPRRYHGSMPNFLPCGLFRQCCDHRDRSIHNSWNKYGSHPGSSLFIFVLFTMKWQMYCRKLDYKWKRLDSMLGIRTWDCRIVVVKLNYGAPQFEVSVTMKKNVIFYILQPPEILLWSMLWNFFLDCPKINKMTNSSDATTCKNIKTMSFISTRILLNHLLNLKWLILAVSAKQENRYSKFAPKKRFEKLTTGHMWP